MITGYILTKNNYVNIDAYKNPLLRALTGFFAGLILSLLVSLDRGESLDIIMINIKSFMVTAVMVKIIDSRKRLDI